MKISKPEIYEEDPYQGMSWTKSGVRIDWTEPPLFETYYVVWDHEAYCGHQMCGWDFSKESFATKELAESFANKLEEENEVVEWP